MSIVLMAIKSGPEGPGPRNLAYQMDPRDYHREASEMFNDGIRNTTLAGSTTLENNLELIPWTKRRTERESI